MSDNFDINRLTERLDKVETQMEDFRKWAAEVNTLNAVRHSEYSNLLAKLKEYKDANKEEYTGIKNNLSKIVWLLIAGIIAGITSFMFDGGFS